MQLLDPDAFLCQFLILCAILLWLAPTYEDDDDD